MPRKSKRAERRGPPAIAACALARAPTVIALMIASIFSVMLLALPAFAQAAAPPMPENASPKSYGDGWQCNIGFRLNEDACVAVVVPQNAYDTHRTYGAGWECLHGYRKTDDAACVAVDVPEGGLLRQANSGGVRAAISRWMTHVRRSWFLNMRIWSLRHLALAGHAS